MSSLDTSTMVESVTRFRVRAQAVFHLWAFAWLRLTGDARTTRDRATLLSAIIQVLYWSVLNRNPTVDEWASDVIEFGALSSLSPTYMRQELERRGHPEAELNMTKPWWALFHMADCDETIAVRDYARQVGLAFLSHRVSNPEEWLPEETDWTKEEHIEAVIKSVLTPPAPKRWWHWFKKSA